MLDRPTASQSFILLSSKKKFEEGLNEWEYNVQDKQFHLTCSSYYSFRTLEDQDDKNVSLTKHLLRLRRLVGKNAQ